MTVMIEHQIASYLNKLCGWRDTEHLEGSVRYKHLERIAAQYPCNTIMYNHVY